MEEMAAFHARSRQARLDYLYAQERLRDMVNAGVFSGPLWQLRNNELVRCTRNWVELPRQYPRPDTFAEPL
ncbi:hypothetical protein [Pseudomonas sp. dw_358]|uniref:hypothetical protein n=1 Tax=Pseudomonas sp. dw_358 TaxID=2720083 RepID=UPI001BD3EBC1|nr:hypothetical protein [Pseudomonas sp. dw_358]